MNKHQASLHRLALEYAQCLVTYHELNALMQTSNHRSLPNDKARAYDALMAKQNELDAVARLLAEDL